MPCWEVARGTGPPEEEEMAAKERTLMSIRQVSLLHIPSIVVFSVQSRRNWRESLAEPLTSWVSNVLSKLPRY
jgi:hypothetical protein